MITGLADEYIPAHTNDEIEHSDKEPTSTSQTKLSTGRIGAFLKTQKINHAILEHAHLVHASLSHEPRTLAYSMETLNSHIRAVASSSASVTNEFATALLVWQNSGS